MDRYLIDLVRRHGRGTPNSIVSVCSAHPFVLEAALENAKESSDYALLESTCNQVNQYGGYSGMRPSEFYRLAHEVAARVGFSKERLILGGDHLGPYPWRHENSSNAMDLARTMVREYVRAGFRKLHIDASMALGDDRSESGRRLDPGLAAERCAELCATAEDARCDGKNDAPLYVIGTEVPVPGGTSEDTGPPEVTQVSDLDDMITSSRSAFQRRGLGSAWERVIAVVVQPGVEFGGERIFGYERERTRALCAALSRYPELAFEGHSTDYQQANHLNQMASDGFAILKVGPALTNAFREAVFLLSHIETEIFANDHATEMARLPEALERAMLARPGHWRPYYHGDDHAIRFARAYSFSDRSRYYWSEETVQQALRRLFSNLRTKAIPLPLISQYFPAQYWRLRQGVALSDPETLVRDKIKDVLRTYPGRQWM